MSGLGDLLRETREKKGLAVAEVAIETRIRDKIILALESGDFHQLPPEPFIRGLLRNYARVLGLEPDLVLDAYAIETGSKPPPVPPSDTLPPNPQRRPLGHNDHTSPPNPGSIFVLRPPDTKPEDTRRVEALERSRDAPSLLSLILPFRNKVDTPAEGLTQLDSSQHPSPLSQAVSTREPTPSFAQGPQPIFQVAPDLPAEAAPVPDQVVFIQRISSTKLPEVVAALAVGVAILALVGFGYTRLFPSESNFSQVVSRLNTKTPTATPQEATTRLPTPVPTFEANGVGAIESAPTATSLPTASSVAPIALIPGDAQMDVEISAGGSPVWAWVVVDNVEVFKGNIQNDDKAWTAHSRLYVQVKDLPNGTVMFDGKSILARVFEERKILERAWEIGLTGTPVPVDPVPFLPSPTAKPTQTPTIVPTNTPSMTATATSTATATATPTPTATASATPTATPSPTTTIPPAPTGTEPASAASDACSGRPGIQC